MIIKCPRCSKVIGEKEPFEDKSVSHVICDECLTKYFPHHAGKIEEILGDEKKRARGNPMKTDVDTCLTDIADFYVDKRREMTEPELESILMKHCGSEAEAKKFLSFLLTEPGQLRFKTLLRERERLPEFETRLQAELTKEFRKEGFLPQENPSPSDLKAEIPDLVKRGIFELKTYGRVSDYYRASQQDKQAVDDWLVGIKHPLAYRPGTMEDRYLAIVKELTAKEPLVDNVEVYTSEVLPVDVAQDTGLHRDPHVEFRYTTYYLGPDLSFFKRDLQRLLRERTGDQNLVIDAYYIRPSENPSYLKEMIAPREIVKAVGHWKPAGRIYGEVVSLQKQGIQYREALEIAMRNPKNWEGFEYLK